MDGYNRTSKNTKVTANELMAYEIVSRCVHFVFVTVLKAPFLAGGPMMRPVPAPLQPSQFIEVIERLEKPPLYTDSNVFASGRHTD